MSELSNANKGVELALVNSATPRTDEAIERWHQGKVNILEELAKLETELNAAVKAEREALAKMCQAVAEADNAERECDEWKSKFVQANKDYGFELRDPCGTIWDHAKKLQQECYNLQDQRDLALRMAEERKKERDQWKADCLEQCQLLAKSADREEKMIAKTGYWESLIHWLKQVQEAYKGRDRDWDLTQVYMRGPFAGWSESDIVKLADKLWENEQKWPLRGDKK